PTDGCRGLVKLGKACRPPCGRSRFPVLAKAPAVSDRSPVRSPCDPGARRLARALPGRTAPVSRSATGAISAFAGTRPLERRDSAGTLGPAGVGRRRRGAQTTVSGPPPLRRGATHG